MDTNLTINIDMVFEDGFPSVELMDAYDEFYHDVTNDADFSKFNTREEKHKANIQYAFLNGQRDFIEGYGSTTFIKKWNITLFDAEHA